MFAGKRPYCTALKKTRWMEQWSDFLLSFVAEKLAKAFETHGYVCMFNIHMAMYVNIHNVQTFHYYQSFFRSLPVEL